MQLHTLRRTHRNKPKKRVGRGGTRGKTSGRGHKGQKARAGGKLRPESRDIIKRIPKRRGHGKHRASSVPGSRPRPSIVKLSAIEQRFAAGETVSPQTLVGKKLVRKRGRTTPAVKVLADGTLSKRLTFSNVSFSASARSLVAASGSTIA